TSANSFAFPKRSNRCANSAIAPTDAASRQRGEGIAFAGTRLDRDNFDTPLCSTPFGVSQAPL
ncbi:MAG TPA: hypothetical protein VFF43_07860, partial [Caldimonas sp.]|nr:hypothetical protein [Caldimonas sp.]